MLGLTDSPVDDQQTVYQEFKERLECSSDGWHGTGLPWKSNHPELSNNETRSQRRLQQLIQKLEHDRNYVKYNEVIQEQIKQGIVEPAPLDTAGKEFYLPHKAII